jgi:cysteinyl-tRNA synthetase
MANAHVHSVSSARKFGGIPEDYINIHMKMDCSKAYVADNRHRSLTHTNFWIHEVMIPIFGYTMKNSAGREFSVKDICEQHILEDFAMKFIPTAQDYLENMEFKDWMQNGIKDYPSSFKKLAEKKNITYKNLAKD